MTEVATSMTSALNAGPDGPSIDDLLNVGTFHQRLAAARAEREKVLAARGDTGAEPQFLAGPKPWERPEYLRGELRKVRQEGPPRPFMPRQPRRPSTPAPAARDVAETVASAPDTTIVVAAQAVPAAITLPALPARRPRLVQLAGGMALGIVVGVGMGFWFARAPLTTADPRIEAAAVTPAAQPPDAGVTATAQAALPASDTAPARPDAPQLSSVTSVSAQLPVITGGGPVGPQMAAAPEAVTVSLTLPEAAVPPAPVVIAPPAPARLVAAALPGSAPERGFSGSVAPLPVSFLVPRSALPQIAADAPPPPPGIPEAISMPASLTLPEAAVPAPGDAPLSAQSVPLPVARPASAGDITLVVHAPAALTDAELATASDAFAAAGFGTIEPKAVDLTIKEANVRFFSPRDEPAAARIAAALGARLRDFTSFSPQPPDGTVEVWLSGRGSGEPTADVKPSKSAKSAKAKKSRSASAGPTQVQILKDRLVRQLRAGVLN